MLYLFCRVLSLYCGTKHSIKKIRTQTLSVKVMSELGKMVLDYIFVWVFGFVVLVELSRPCRKPLITWFKWGTPFPSTPAYSYVYNFQQYYILPIFLWQFLGPVIKYGLMLDFPVPGSAFRWQVAEGLSKTKKTQFGSMKHWYWQVLMYASVKLRKSAAWLLTWS